MITVSVCMIVKNEELVLARCLDCLKDFADEIIIVDTGSVDSTKEIAYKYTDKVYDFEWIDDFSAARNFAFSKATMDYIYTADADEVIDIDNQKKLLDLKKILLPEIDIVQLNYTNQLEFGSTYNYDREPRPKLFKRLRTFMWQDPVHETIVTDPVIYDSDIDIIHKPHEMHADRDFRVFRKVIEQAKSKEGIEHITAGLSANARMMYAKELYISGEDKDFLDAYEYFKNLLASGILNEDQLNETYCILTRCARITGNVSDMMKYTLKNAITSPCSEICNEIGQYYMDIGDYEEAYIWFYNAAYETKPILSIKHGFEIPVKNLVTCCEKCGNAELSLKFAKELEGENYE